MNFQSFIDTSQRLLSKKAFGQALELLRTKSPENLWERNILRKQYINGGDAAYKERQLLLAISFFEGAKLISHTPEELIQTDRRIYFTLFVHFHQEGKKLYESGNLEEATPLFSHAINSYERYPKDNTNADKAWAFMQTKIPEIQEKLATKYVPNPGAQPTNFRPETLDLEDPKAKPSLSDSSEPRKRLMFKLAISAGLAFYKENRFKKALQEFEKALEIQQTDHLLEIIGKCKLGLSLLDELEKHYGKAS